MATPTLNGSTNMDASTLASKLAGPNRQQAKSPHGGKNVDLTRKASNSQDDSSQKRDAPKAWSSGRNPITQRTNTPSSQTNGTITSSKPVNQKNVTSQESNTPDKHANDRLVHLLGNMLGLSATISIKNGEVFTGLFAGAMLEGPEPSYMLKMVQRNKISDKASTNGASEATEYIGNGADHSMIFSAADLVDIAVENVPEVTRVITQNGTSSGFRTDAEISGNLAGREKTLQRWESPAAAGVDMSLESAGDWDQFKANEQQFGLTSDYDENLYTTRIDKNSPLYKIREAEAQRIAREIEGDTSNSNNAHMREERGLHYDDDGLDEEEKYSGVHRNGQDYPPLQSNQPNKYTPPARRPQVLKPAASGSSLDPAIISSQIAQPAKPKDVALEENSILKPAEPAAEAPKKTLPHPTQSSTVKEPSAKPTLSALQTKPGASATVTENIEGKVLDSYRNFANSEKMKVQESRRNRASADKAIKLNDLMKFSKNFKLLTPVPKDLVPILAKDKSKQEKIIEKAQRQAEEYASQAAKSTSTDQNNKILTKARWEQETGPSDTQTASRGRQPQPSQPAKDRQAPPMAPAQPSKSGSQGMLSHRLHESHRMHKAGLPVSVPAPLPIQDVRGAPSSRPSNQNSPQKAITVRSPTSANSLKFNVKAMEFKPNPAANMFKPTVEPSATSSPRSGAMTRSVSRATSPSLFWGDRKPKKLSDRPSIMDYFNPLKYLHAEAEKEDKTKEYAANGGIKPAYKTPPTWNTPKNEDEFKSYRDMFSTPRPVGSQTASPSNAPLTHQHQLPLHLQNGHHNVPQVQTPHQVHPIHTQVHYSAGPQHFDDHHMRPSASTSSIYPSPSPRMGNLNMAAYPSPMGPQAQLAYGTPLPLYFSGHAPQPTGFRQMSGPQLLPTQGPHLTAAPMMVQQGSSNGIMAYPQQMGLPLNPQIPMYPNGAPQQYVGPPPPTSGYPSPRQGAPMMMHQGSHHGQHPPMYAAPNQYGQPVYAQHQPVHMQPMRGYASPQPHYSQSPYQQHHYPHQPHRTPSSGYAQLPQAHHQHMGSQQVPPPAAPLDMGEEAK